MRCHLPTSPPRPLHSPPIHGPLPARERGFESPETFGRLVEPHLPLMFRAARDILPSDDIAWDAVQETLLRIWIRGWLPSQPRGALKQLAQSSSLHLLRCASRRRRHEALSEPQDGLCCEEDPLATLEQDERAAAVRAAVRAMPPRYRRVLERFEFDGASYQSIADELALPIGTVRSRLSRARDLVREHLLRST